MEGVSAEYWQTQTKNFRSDLRHGFQRLFDDLTQLGCRRDMDAGFYAGGNRVGDGCGMRLIGIVDPHVLQFLRRQFAQAVGGGAAGVRV